MKYIFHYIHLSESQVTSPSGKDELHLSLYPLVRKCIVHKKVHKNNLSESQVTSPLGKDEIHLSLYPLVRKSSDESLRQG